MKSHDCRGGEEGRSGGQALELSDEGEEEGGDGREQLLVVTGEDSEDLRALAAQARLPPYGSRRRTAGAGG